MDDVERSDDKPGAAPLFSRSASDNAEVVADRSPQQDGGLWSVSAKQPDEPTLIAAEPTPGGYGGSDSWDETDGDDLWDLIEDESATMATPFPPPPFGQPYRSPLVGRVAAEEPPVAPENDRWVGWADDDAAPAEAVETTPPRTFFAVGDDEDEFELDDDPDDGVFEASIVDEEVDDLRDDLVDDLDGDPADDAPSDFYGDGIFTDGREAGGSSYDTDPDDGSKYGSWSTDGSAATDGPGTTDGSGTAGEGLRDSVGSLFRSEPVERIRDVIDSSDEVEIDQPVDRGGPSPFSSGVPHERTDPSFPSRRSERTAFSEHIGFAPGPRATFVGPEPAAADPGVADPMARTDLIGEATTPGFQHAIEALDPQERSKARTALVVVGALFEADEQVSGLVVGQMLGHPAVLVLTDRRVLVVNDRPWQPVVDRYVLDDELEIRGRHDQNMAAIGLGDGVQLSMVDGIRDVPAAIGLVDRIRSTIGLDPTS